MITQENFKILDALLAILDIYVIHFYSFLYDIRDLYYFKVSKVNLVLKVAHATSLTFSSAPN